MNKENKDKLYALQRALDKIYFSESFNTPYDKRKKRFAHKLLDHEKNEFVLKGEHEIGASFNGRRQLKALFFEDQRRIEKLIVQQFGVEDNPIKNSIREA